MVVLLGLCLTIATDAISIGVVLTCLFLPGTAEVFAHNTSATLLPMLIHRDDLAIGNAGLTTVNQLAGPPLRAALFATGMLWPFVGQAVLVALGALLVSRVVLPPHGRLRERTSPAPARHRGGRALGLGGVGFGPLTTVSAVGGLLGTAAYGWITRRLSLGNIMRVGLIIETVTHLRWR